MVQHGLQLPGEIVPPIVGEFRKAASGFVHNLRAGVGFDVSAPDNLALHDVEGRLRRLRIRVLQVRAFWFLVASFTADTTADLPLLCDWGSERCSFTLDRRRGPLPRGRGCGGGACHSSTSRVAFSHLIIRFFHLLLAFALVEVVFYVMTDVILRFTNFSLVFVCRPLFLGVPLCLLLPLPVVAHYEKKHSPSRLRWEKFRGSSRQGQ